MTNNTKSSISKNYLYNMTYEVFLLIVPFAITPYVSRALGPESSGQYSYLLSIATYFTLVASLGFDRYAQRQIATHRGDLRKQATDFWEIIICRLCTTLASLTVYSFCLFQSYFGEKYFNLALVLALNIIAIGIDSTFFFQGNEEFKKIVVRNIIVKSIGFICIFVFVKDETDLIPYALIQSMIIVVSNLSLWFYLPKNVFAVKISELKPIKHLKPSLLLFLPTIAISVYTSLDKTLIGIITKSDAENGYYEYSEKIVKMALMVITSLGAVMIPRNSQKVAQEGRESITNNIHMALRFVFFIGTPLCLGLMAVSSNFVPWYLGDGYDKATVLVKVLSPIIVVIGISNVLGVQFLIPTKQDGKYTTSIVIGACLNFAINCLLIPMLGSIGAAIGTLVAETCVTTFMIMFTHRQLELRRAVVEMAIWKYLMAGGVMFGVVFSVSHYLSATILHTVFLVIMGAVIYPTILFALKDEFLLFFVIPLIKRNFKRNKKA